MKRDGAPIVLGTTTEFELLRYFMRNPLPGPHACTDLGRTSGTTTSAGRASIVDLYVSYLRKKLDSGRPAMLHTVRGVGYLLRPAE